MNEGGPATEPEVDVERLVRDGVLTPDEARSLAHSQQSDAGRAPRMEALPSTVAAPTAAGDGPTDKDAVKEAAVKHKRHWVRITRVCNQRCTFCLDSMNQDGTMIDVESLKAYIALGRRMGRQRLILSGGEASLHPDFIELIRYGHEVGYDWVQTVTNGMMFAYKRFARACARAGLNEATVSMHGHTARLQDRLTGTPGAFVTAIKGMKNLMATGQVVVNVDVVINKQNYRQLPEIIAFYYNMGVREFDLLHIIPFGRGFDEHRRSLFFDLNEAVPYLRRAFAWGDRPDVYLWTNRLPVPYLEDFERLIQDPHKLFYEFDGGRHNFEGYLKRGLKPDCHGERCDYCFLDGPCRSTMFPYREHLLARSFPVLKLDARHVFAGSAAREVFEAQRPGRLWLTAASVQEAAERLADLDLGGARVTVELAPGADPAGLRHLPGIARAATRDVAGAARYLVGPGRLPAPLEVEVLLDRALAAWLLARPSTLRAWAGRLVLNLPGHAYLSESQAADPTPETLRRLAAAGARLKNVPRCVAGAEVEPPEPPVLEATMLDAGGDLDLDGYVRHYIATEYHARSLRCHRCAFIDGCRGLHVNYLRNHGFRILTPLDPEGRALEDAASFQGIAAALMAGGAGRGRGRTLPGRHSPAPEDLRRAEAGTRGRPTEPGRQPP